MIKYGLISFDQYCDSILPIGTRSWNKQAQRIDVAACGKKGAKPMAAPYDVVVTIDGQSFVDGFWRILAPALERLSSPLPIAIPGFTNAQMRVTNLVPIFPLPTAGNGLAIAATIELTGEALLHVIQSTDSVSVALGPQAINLSSITGSLTLPAETGNLTNLQFTTVSGAALGLGSGAINLAATGPGTLSGVTGAGQLQLPANLVLPGLPLPAVVPVAIDLTPAFPLPLIANVPVVMAGPNTTTRFGLLFVASGVTVTVPTLPTGLAATLTTKLQTAVDQIVSQLAIPGLLTQPTVDPLAVGALLAPIPAVISAALDEALTLLFAETGRLVYPAAAAGASCDVRALPNAADATLVFQPSHGLRLQIGFNRSGTTGTIPALPTLGTNPVECQVLVGNGFVLELLCCLVERLPSFSLPVAATTGTSDVAGTTHVMCCNFTGVTAAFGPLVIGGGGISVCIDGMSGGTKTLSVVGSFSQSVPNVVPLVSSIFGTMATVSVGFTLPVAFDFDDVASIANLRLSGTPTVTTSVNPSAGLIFSVLAVILLLALLIGLAGGWIASAVLGIMSPLAAAIIVLLVYLACGAVNYLLGNAVRMVLAGASLLRSPVALPPGLLDAFGRLSPVSVTIDDLAATGVMHTPTSVWGLIPRLGIQKRERPPSGGGKDPTHKPAQPTPGAGRPTTDGPPVSPSGRPTRATRAKSKP